MLGPAGGPGIGGGNCQDMTMMSSDGVLDCRTSNIKVDLFSRVDSVGSEEGRRWDSDKRLETLCGQFNNLSVWGGGISQGEKRWNVLSNTPPRRCIWGGFGLAVVLRARFEATPNLREGEKQRRFVKRPDKVKM